MGKLAVYRYFALMFLILTIVVMMFTFIGLFGGSVDPAGNTAMAMLVYVLPLLIICNVLLLIYWLVRRKWKWSIMPIVSILCCVPYVGTIFQFGSLDTSADKIRGIKIATYNVEAFSRETTGFKAEAILAEMKKQKVDVLCMQEYAEHSGDKKNSDSYKEYFPYMQKGKDDMVIYSKYPITETKNMPFEATNNSAMWATINVKGKAIRIFNVHIETTGFNRTVAKAGKIIAKGGKVEQSSIISAIYGNYTLGMVIRAGQARMVANEIQNTNGPVIVCGDFNDVPYSYVYNTMLGNLVDGFKECGTGGLMVTYRHPKKPVRIDYIFHDESLEGISYYCNDEVSYSDHNPVFMRIAL